VFVGTLEVRGENMASMVAASAGVVLIGVGAVIAGVVLLVLAAVRHPRHPRILRLGPSFFFWLEIFYLTLLVAIAVAYNRNDFGLKNAFEGGLIGGILPLGVPWFGAVGAVVISLQGVFDHSTNWDRRYNHWHLARPLFGTVLGTVAFFIFVLLLKSTGSELEFLTPEAAPDDFIVYYVVAFLVGYREETFRELVRRAVDLVFKPGGLITAAKATVRFQVSGSEKSDLDFGETAIGETTQTLEVHNVGGASLTAPTVTVRTTQPADGSQFVSRNDAVTAAGDIAPGAFRTVEIVFAPDADGDFVGLVEVASPSLEAPASIEITGKGKSVPVSES
jgi:hypothetical protein